jgi:hypothetical protein
MDQFIEDKRKLGHGFTLADELEKDRSWRWK